MKCTCKFWKDFTVKEIHFVTFTPKNVKTTWPHVLMLRLKVGKEKLLSFVYKFISSIITKRKVKKRDYNFFNETSQVW